MTTASGPQHRSSFRVNQDVIFDFRQVDSLTADTEDADKLMNEGPAMQMLGELRRIDREAQDLLKIVADKQRLLGDYLQKLNAKVDLIARHFAFDNDQNGHPQRVNLSETGVAFRSPKVLYKGNYLVMRLIFLPTYTPVVVFGVVARCEQVNNEYQVATQFHRLRDLERQLIAKQVLKTQVTLRKKDSALE
jgi:hypothetical protein